METTIRQHMNIGEVAEPHNMRDEVLAEKESHIDTKHGIHEVWVRDRTTEEAYKTTFGEAIEDYNSRQKRKDRRMTVASYMKSVEEDTRGRMKSKRVNGKKAFDLEAKKGKRLVYETVVSVGSSTEKERGENGRTVYSHMSEDDGKVFHPMFTAGEHEIRPYQVPYEVNYRACRRYAETFEERNKQMIIVRVDWHADEGYMNQRGVWEWGIPHAHIEWIPLADGYKRGLEVQNAISRCLEQMGYVGGTEMCLSADGRPVTKKDGEFKTRFVSAYEKWNREESKAFEAIVQEEYASWCMEHLPWVKDHGIGVDFLHPVAGKDSVQNLDPEMFREVQRLKDTVEEKREELSDTIVKVTVMKHDLHKIEKKKADADTYKEETEAYCEKLKRDTEERAGQLIIRMQRIFEQFEEEAERQVPQVADISREIFMKKHPKVETAYQAWVQNEYEARERERKTMQKDLMGRIIQAQNLLSNFESGYENDEISLPRRRRRDGQT